MMKHKAFLSVLMAIVIGVFAGTMPPAQASTDITGQWYGTWEMSDTGYSSNFSINFAEDPAYGLLAEIYVPEFGLFNEYLPVTIDATPSGYLVMIGFPGFLVLSGELEGNSIAGAFDANPFTGFWQIQRFTGEDVYPGEAPGPQCENLPPPFCMGSAEYCSDLVLFEPVTGTGYVDQTDENRNFSYLRRDLMHLVKYATAKVACKTADWDYGNFAPLGLLDMSEWDGSTPGTHYPPPRHPPGTHDFGRDIDTAYYQLYAADNLGRPVCVHFEGESEAYHCVGEPYALDKWRSALFIAYLSEHPRVRVIGVDGKAGPIVEDALDELVGLSWIDAELRDSISLAYEGEDTGLGWYRFHHHHLHTSMNLLYDIVADAELKPDVLNRNSRGKYVTAHIEPHEGIDVGLLNPDTVALILGGHTMLYAERGKARVEDYNDNGIADLGVKFDRQKMMELIDNGKVEISITGLFDDYFFFQASDTVRILGGQHGKSSLKRGHPHAITYPRPGGRGIRASD